jgi:hypothetical protein
VLILRFFTVPLENSDQGFGTIIKNKVTSEDHPKDSTTGSTKNTMGKRVKGIMERSSKLPITFRD